MKMIKKLFYSHLGLDVLIIAGCLVAIGACAIGGAYWLISSIM